MPRVLIVDDSPTARLGIRQALEAHADLQVVGEAGAAAQALERARALRPDLITMDVCMGREDGVDITATIMREAPAPILIVTAMGPRDPGLAFRALEAGALEVLAKPRGGPAGEADRRMLVRAVRAMAGMPVVTRRGRGARSSPPPVGDPSPEPSTGRIERVLVGASTGGPPLLHQVFEQVPAPLPVPVVVIQHVMPGFSRGLVDWLSAVTGHPVKLCEQPTRMAPGHLYFAPDRRHLHLTDPGALAPHDAPPRRFQRPSVDELFDSAVGHRPESTLALVLTGMGDDGAAGLLALRRAGARTVAQRPSTCVADSMPSRAIEQGAAGEVLDPAGIVRLLATLEGNGARRRGAVA